jgi:LysM repeat protein
MKTNTPNPLVPQGTFSEPKAKSNLRMTVFLIIAGHLVLISGLLMAGCKKTSTEPQPGEIPFPDLTNPPLTQTSNFPTPPPAIPTTPPPVEIPITPAPVVTTPPPVTHITGEVEREHTIVAKDTFSTLAKQYNVTVPAITAANPGVDSKRLKIGQKVKIPAPTAAKPAASAAPATGDSGEKIYVVKSGDKLINIATSHKTSVAAIKAANNLPTDRIKVGQKLKIPSKAAAAPATPTPAPFAAPTESLPFYTNALASPSPTTP